MSSFSLSFHSSLFRDKLKEAHEELQKKKAYIDSLEPKAQSSCKHVGNILYLNPVLTYPSVFTTLSSFSFLSFPFLSFPFFFFLIAEKVNELQGMLVKKEQEMKVMEDRYKKYLEKAKSVRA